MLLNVRGHGAIQIRGPRPFFGPSLSAVFRFTEVEQSVKEQCISTGEFAVLLSIVLDCTTAMDSDAGRCPEPENYSKFVDTHIFTSSY